MFTTCGTTAYGLRGIGFFTADIEGSHRVLFQKIATDNDFMLVIRREKC